MIGTAFVLGSSTCGTGTPRSYQDAVDLLVDHDVLPTERREAFRAMVRFRNRAVHLYDEVDAEDVYEILENDLDDFEEFVRAIVDRYFAQE